MRFWRAVFSLLAFAVVAAPVQAQSLLKAAIQVDPGNTKPTGQTFGYRLTYNCSSTSGPCLSAQVVDLLPPEVQFISTVPASPTGDVAAINVTPNFSGSGRTRVQFVLVTPLPAGNSGDLIVNVRFPNGTTPDGTVATNTADGINLGTTPGTLTTPPVTVTAVAALNATLQKTLQTSPANLDLPETYRLRIAVSGDPGTLGLTAVGPVVDTLPPGTVFNGATPAADCQPGCVGTTPATVTWTSPCSLPVNAGATCDIQVNVTFPSATFPSGTNVTNSFTASVTPLGQSSQTIGPGQVTHPVTTFVPAPGAGLTKAIAGGSANPPTLNQTFSYDIAVSNSGNVPLDNLVLIDTLPVEFALSNVTTGAYTGLADFAAGSGVRVSYEKNTAPGVFTLWGSSPNTTTTTTLTAPPPGLGAGEYVTRVRWEFGQAAVGMNASTRPLITGRVVNPDNTGGPVAFGDSVQNCVALSAVYSAGPTNVTRNSCNTFNLSGPFVQLNPAKDNLSGGGPFNPGQTINWRLRVRSAPQSSDPVPLNALVVTDLLPVNLMFTTWTFDDQGTGLPAPQTFEQIPNFAGTGRTLLRWRWNAGSGSLGVNQQVFINTATTVRNGSGNGNLSNDLTIDSDAPGLGLRCSSASQSDTLDLDGDGDTVETLCRATGTIAIAGIAQLISAKTTRGVCEANFGTSGSTLPGAQVRYRIQVTNPGTVEMTDVVLIDLLPAPGDTGVRDTTPRGSQWQPRLVAPIVPPSGTALYYSTAANPCRGEIGGPTTGCDAPNWTTVAPEPITAVRAFKLEFGARTIAPFDTLAFEFDMAAPANLPAGPAFNSFAYQAHRGDGLGALAAEPVKVGVSLGSCAVPADLGDYVWRDDNGNGLQDETNTGVNSVNVALYFAGPDGIAGTPDDVLSAQTITQDSPGGQPGWYRFPNLVAGTWRVCVTPPAGSVLSPTDQGGNDAQDSDADPASGCSAPVVLSPNEEDLSVDFGLVPTAALGDYVWFDRNANGVQDEPASEGVNGVTVRLYADDGDGTAEPGGGDALVALTATAVDAYGNPGYYRFDALVPGERYFVQFELPPVAGAFAPRDTGGDDAVDSDAQSGSGTTALVILAPAEVNRTLDAGLVLAAGTLSLGDQIWGDTDNDGVYEPQSGELGIDAVDLRLYRDANGNGTADAGEYVGATASGTASGFSGRYRFTQLTPGNYLVVVAPSNFASGGALVGLAGADGNDPAPDPDDDVNGDDNGTQDGALVVSRAITLTANGEPTSEDGNSNTNLTLDFGFVAQVPARYDYGDAPDAGAGSSAGNYATTAFDGGPQHRLGVNGAPYLGSCVDADDGSAQDVTARGDDSRGGLTTGACITPGHDEDGVTFTTAFTPGSPASIDLRAANTAVCVLNAWIDWNANGVFTDAGEQIASDLSIAAGTTTTLTPAVPTLAQIGTSYARFRCASSGGLTPIGAAADGEVEDYRIFIGGNDYGDAPASYGTQGAGAARHAVASAAPLMLGQCLDLESDGQPGATADGDDTTAGARFGLCFDDENGVTLLDPVAACQNVDVAVTASAAGQLDAWIDFNQDGDFVDSGEQIFASQSVSGGANPLNFSVPCTALSGTTYARYRLSSAGGLGPAGTAPDGEVEDYVITGGSSDFGDAPAPYPTLVADNGPRHAVVNGFSLGATLDGEADGQPTTPADGDGADEDGVSLVSALDACATQNLSVALTNTAGLATPRLDAWIDFNRDGDWNDAGERIANALALTAGANALSITVPCDVSPGASYARFRLSSAGVANPAGLATDGEVEDYRIVQRGADYGDAPDTYQTLAASGGALHRIDPASTLYLGNCADTETDGQPGIAANGDDTNAGAAQAGTCSANDDEDGAVFAAPLAACRSGSVTLGAGAAGQLDGWIDFDRDGSFETTERIFDHVALAAGSTTLSFPIPCAAAPGASYARLRLSTAGSNGPAGVANDGEVEDHAVTLTGVDYGDAPDSYGTSAANSGPTHVLAVPGLFLGACVDGEADAATPLDGSGDDNAAGSTVSGTCAAGGDEDGVDFTTALIACKATPVTVRANAAGRVDAWIDFNNDGDFGDAGEQVFTSTAVSAGANALNFSVPCASAGGSLYSRFRLSTAGGLAPTGPAADGEVEDHRIQGAQQADFGDAPASYATTFASNGPRHGVAAGSTLFLGSCVDTEADAAAPLDGSGDDAASGSSVAGTCSGNDDEDGVVFATPLVACSAGNIAVTAGSNGRLDAWIDFNRNGSFDEPAERIANAVTVNAGSNTLAVTVPCTANPGTSYARFRLSDGGGLGAVGASPTGEVEDHALTLQGADWGDAPDSYGTAQAGNGARHGVRAGFSLGATVDVEADGQPSTGADGDGADEDGIAFGSGTRFDACATQSVGVTLVNSAAVAAPRLDAWIDFDADGRFDEPRDRIASALTLVSGSNSLSVSVPCDVTAHVTSYARFRLSDGGVATALGAALAGEVEDYAISTSGLDYGDAPSPYPTLRADDGARHRVLAAGNPTLGANVDTEGDGQPVAAASGDDLAGSPDDEDGVVFAGVLVPGTNATVDVSTGASGGLIDGWVDFNRDGDFADAGEQILISQALGAGLTQSYSFAVPIDAVSGSSIARLRVSTGGTPTPTGLAPDGEIEDHLVAIGAAAPSVGLAKALALVERNSPLSYRVSYDLRLANTGNVPLTDVRISDDLAAVFVQARSVAVAALSSADFAVNPAYNGSTDLQLLAPGNNLAVGAAGTLRLVVVIELRSYFGPFDNTATAAGSAPGGGSVTDVSQNGINPDPDNNGNPGDNSVPTPVSFAVVLPVAAPALGPLGLLLLALLVCATALRRRSLMR